MSQKNLRDEVIAKSFSVNIISSNKKTYFIKIKYGQTDRESKFKSVWLLVKIYQLSILSSS